MDVDMEKTMVNGMIKKYRDPDSFGKYIYKPLPNGDVEMYIGLIPPNGFGLKPSIDELNVKITNSVRRGTYFMYVRTYYGSHADDYEDFTGSGKTMGDAVNNVLNEVHIWLNHSMYASDHRSELGITDNDYLIKPEFCEYLKYQEKI